MNAQTRCTAFAGPRRIATGALSHVARRTKEILAREEGAPVLIFDDTTGEPIEVDFRGTADDVLHRLAKASDDEAPATAARGPGRPRLGVVAREVTLLPRHWEWLNRQPGGASVALRKLVEDARHMHKDRDRVRQAREAAYKFMSAMAGNERGFEEAARALFAHQEGRFETLIRRWPADIRDHLKTLAGRVFHNHGNGGEQSSDIG